MLPRCRGWVKKRKDGQQGANGKRPTSVFRPPTSSCGDAKDARKQAEILRHILDSG